MNNSSINIFQTGYVLNDKWVIIEFIDKGAMGEVYRAHQLNLKRDVAIKVISQEMLQSFEDDPEEIETAVQRFRREVEAMARFRHPNVLQIFDYGSELITKKETDVAVEYIVMEFIPGATLRFTMSEDGFYPEHDLTATWLVDYFLPLLDGVEAIHAKDVVHRDLKPENVLIDGAIPKIVDFGLAGSMRMKPVTQSIEVRGTPAYMSPEHFFDFKKADQLSDIYSLGKILFEAVEGTTGEETLPFKSVGLQNKDTPFFEQLDWIIQNATAERKEERLQSVEELRKALLHAIDILKTEIAVGADTTPKRFSYLAKPHFIWAGIVIAIVTVGLMVLWHLIGEPGKTTRPLTAPQVSQTSPAPPGKPELPKAKPTAPTPPAPSVRGEDGVTMRLIPGGEVKISPKDLNMPVQTVQIQSFYLDEKMVSNHHFNDFLNEVKASLTIENGVVKNKDEIWFYLGKSDEPFEQIIYEHGRFHLRDTKYAAYPVVRVTWYGASAYARHYDKRLATESEWDYLLSNKSLIADIDKDNQTSASSKASEDAPAGTEEHPRMMNMEPSSGSSEASVHTPPEHLTKQWVTRSKVNLNKRSETGGQQDISYPSLVVGKLSEQGSATKIFRYPWEAFSDVGFRCAKTLGSEK
jgi:serine/threonine-protein kinase